MTDPKITITHVHKHINSTGDAFALGFAEWFGRGAAFAVIILGLQYMIPLAADHPEDTDPVKTEQTP